MKFYTSQVFEYPLAFGEFNGAWTNDSTTIPIKREESRQDAIQPHSDATTDTVTHESTSCNKHNRMSAIKNVPISRGNQISTYYANTGQEDLDGDLIYETKKENEESSK